MNDQIPAQAIREGRLVVFPTETVYGLGANAFSAEAVGKIFLAKGRPLNDPLIVHVAPDWLIETQNSHTQNGVHPYLLGLQRLHIIGALTPEQQVTLSKLIGAFWPGALTLVMPRGDRIPLIVTAGGDTVAIRMPNHPIALALIGQSGVPIAAPSANRFGHISPTTAQHVRDDLGDKVDMILDGGETLIGVESTVLSVLMDEPVILRHGGVTREQIAAVLNCEVNDHTMQKNISQPLQSPGLLERHYAPHAQLIICDHITQLLNIAQHRVRAGQNVGILATQTQSTIIRQQYPDLPMYVLGDDLAAIAHGLYAGLRTLDSLLLNAILAVSVPRVGIGHAIMDRLSRAAIAMT
jgi:L-threonylcarbamoyladenylate synthase